MHQSTPAKPKQRLCAKTADKLASGLIASVLLAAAHAQAPGDEEALQEELWRQIFYQGDFSEAKRIADQAREAAPNTSAQEKTRLLFWITDVCHAAGPADIPKKDMPTTEEMSRLPAPGLECVDYREGLGVTQDYQAYRKCLLSKPYTLQENFPVAEMYAHGWGVPRNRRLATALICRDNASLGDREIMLRQLETSGDLTRSCDHGTLGDMFRCGLEKRYVDERRSDLKLDQIKSGLSARDRALFERVLSAQAAFGDTRRANEFDREGQPSRFASFLNHLEEKKGFVAAIELFESRKFPSIYDVSAADQELNRLYQTIAESLKENPIGSITFDGVRKTQRLWLSYRDHFIRFALARYPGTKREQWLTWLTKSRVEQLKELAEDIGAE